MVKMPGFSRDLGDKKTPEVLVLQGSYFFESKLSY
jgi:hypothetical protein